jgi:gluconokinase
MNVIDPSELSEHTPKNGPAKAVVLTGVSGSGKTTVGRALSEATGWPFFDGDEFHPPSNVEKMAKGVPLNDMDRKPWLETLHTLILDQLNNGQSVIVASSALKFAYRRILEGGRDDVTFVYLQGSYDLIWSRMRLRSDHFMKAGMLQSQFDDLEEPEKALVVSVEGPIEEIVHQILTEIV